MTYFKDFKQLIQISLIVSIVIVFYSLLSSADPTVELNAFLVLIVLWNCIPLFISYLLIFYLSKERFLTKVKDVKTPILIFAIINIGFTTFIHLAWIFDWNNTASGSSTSALIFIFIPIFSGIIATVIASTFFVICKLRNLYMKNARLK